MSSEPLPSPSESGEAAPLPEWQHGYQLAFLKELCQPFKRQKPWAFGAFSLPRERDVAEAIVRGRAWFTKDRAAILLTEPVRKPRAWTQFSGESIPIPSGSCFVSAFSALSMEAGRRLLRELLARAEAKADPEAQLLAPALYLEAFAEDELVKRLCAELGLVWIGTKVAASSSIMHLWTSAREVQPMVPSIPDRATLCTLAENWLPEEDLAEISAELVRWDNACGPFAQHYSSYNKRRSWTAIALRGFDARDPHFIQKPAEMDRAWKKEHAELLQAACENTTAAPVFPRTMQVVSRLPGAAERIRFMRLAPGGELTRHADIIDPDAGTANGKQVRLHISIASHPDCLFRAWDLDGCEIHLYMRARSLCYIDTRKPHAVINRSKVARTHLVVDLEAGDWTRELLTKAQR